MDAKAKNLYEPIKLFYKTAIDMVDIISSYHSPVQYGTKNFVLNFRTIQLNLGRQTFKTSFLLEEVSSDDIVFFYNHEQKDRFKRELKRILMSASSYPILLAWGEFSLYPDKFMHLLKKNSSSRIFIDNSVFFKESDIEKIFNYMVVSPNQKVILLG